MPFLPIESRKHEFCKISCYLDVSICYASLGRLGCNLLSLPAHFVEKRAPTRPEYELDCALAALRKELAGQSSRCSGRRLPDT